MSIVAAKRRGLGRGLEALIGTPETMLRELEEGSERLRMLPLDSINRGLYQPRIHFEPDALEELAASIRKQGVLQPVLVRKNGNEYELIAGERRWRAAQMAGLEEIPAVVRELDDTAAAVIGLIENIQREDLNPLEQANALQRLIEEFGLTHQQVADAVGRSRTAITNLLRLRELTGEVKQMLERGELDMGHARALLGLNGNAQIALAQRIARQGLSVRETEKLVSRTQAPATHSSSGKQRDPDIARLERDLADRLGARVHIRHGGSGSGKLVIEYKSSDELEGILRKIK